MWFLGLILGLIIGNIFGGAAIVVCGVAGLVLGLFYSYKYPPNKTQENKSYFESRLEMLERRVSELESQLANKQQNHVPAQSTQLFVATRESEPVTAEIPMETAAISLREPPGNGAEITADPILNSQPAFQFDTSGTRVDEQVPPNKILHWLLTGEHAIARIGVVILFIGIGFLVKYAADHALFPIELRLSSAVLIGIALLTVGWRMRVRHAAYALILQGGGTGILYLTIYGAFHIWHLIPAGLAFPLLICVAVLSTLLAVWQNTLTLALFGTTGGFLAPLLTATDSGNHIALFTYYAILNLGIFTAAWFKSWRILNLVGFVFTFAIALLWGAQNYRPELFASTEPFLVLFFLMYVGIALLYSLRCAPDLKNYIDGGLIFGVPVVGFGLQAALVRDFEYGLAISSLVLGAFYLSLCWFIQKRRRDDLRLLVESFLALGVIFATLAIPLACDAIWTSAAWAVEGAGIFWFGSRQNKRAVWGFGLLLQAGAGISFMIHASVAMPPVYPINHLLTGSLMLAMAGFTSYYAAIRQQTNSKLAEWTAPLFLWGLAWWLYGGLNDINNYAAPDYRITLGLLFLTSTALIFSLIALRWNWPHALWPVQSFTVVLWVAALAGIAVHGHPFAHFGAITWVVALTSQYWMLLRHESSLSQKLQHTFHSWSYLLLASLGAWEMHWLSGEYQLQHNAWSVTSLIAIPVLLLVAVSRPSLENFWPLSRHLDTYRQQGALPVAIALWLWTFYANLTHDGASQPLPYLPLLNAIDIGHGMIILSVWAWLMQIRNTAQYNKTLIIRAGGVAMFVWLNAILLRTLHHWAGVAYQIDALMQSMLVQTALSLFWTLLAMALMIGAARRGMRPLWIVGATLMGVVLVKLLLVDLAQSGTLERIISFTGVGMLMLLIGYSAPYPKKVAP